MKLKLSTLCFTSVLCLINFNIFGQSLEKVNQPNNIKSIELKSSNLNNYTPIVKLGDILMFSFDDLDADEKRYSYTIIHCNYNWQKSRIAATEFVAGFASDNIRDYNNSFNTYQAYTHYQLSIPNEKTQLKVSGNYIVQVRNDLDELVFTRRFMVYEPQITVGLSIHKSQLIEDFNTHQNLEFRISTNNLKINNPSDEIKISLYQNNDWNTVKNNIKPQYYSGNQLIYKYADKTLYEAGNEFLYFDTKNIRTATNHVQKTILNDLYQTYLYVDKDRHNMPYTYYPDINGNFVIRSLSGETAITEADYSWVHFRLNLPYQPDKSVYVYGNFNDWQLQDEQKMIYNQVTGNYQTKLLLKQGFYNYKYVERDSNGLKLNSISGNFYQTENSYTALVYLVAFGSRYDRLIGIGTANSRILQN